MQGLINGFGVIVTAVAGGKKHILYVYLVAAT